VEYLLCTALEIEHRLTPPKSPQTNGMVERFNGRIEEVLQSHHFRSGEEMETTQHRYAWLVLWIGAAPGVKGRCAARPPHHLWWAVAAVGP